MNDTITLSIDGTDVTVAKGSTVMQACTAAGKEIPHFCYHERLSVAGNCRMCMVEIEGAPKPVASCHWPAADGMKVKTQGPVTEEARKGTMEMLLLNHPLDCPICDQGGECELQDMAVAYGSDVSRFDGVKRAVDDKEIGAKIKTVMTRCIHCMRCVRFATEIAGVEEFGATGRGAATEVGTYIEKALTSELAGNMIDLCPVGALTNKPYAFSARPWELTKTAGIDVMDGLGGHISIEHRAGKVMRFKPREFDAINEEWMTDTARFCFDALASHRIQTPMQKKGGKWKEIGWPEAMKLMVKTLKGKSRERMAALAGDIHCAEDYYAFNAFMKQTLKCDNVDARTDGSTIEGTNPANYLLQLPIEEVEQADAVLLVGCNVRFEAPLLLTRLRKAVKKGAQVFSLGDIGEQVLPYTLAGESLAAVTPDSASFKALENAKKPLIILGSAVLSRTDALAHLFQMYGLSKQVGAVQENWHGVGVLQRTAGRVAALQLAVYPQAGGKDTAAICDALAGEKMDILFQYGDVAAEGPCDETTLRQAKTLIYMGTHFTAQAEQADILLPTAAFTEKGGYWVNTEGRVQETNAAVLPPLNAKEDWKIFRALSEELGKPLPFDTLTQLRTKLAEAHIAYKHIGKLPLWDAANVTMGKKGKVLEVPYSFPTTQENFYLSNEILRNSAAMLKCQAEVLGDDMEEAA